MVQIDMDIPKSCGDCPCCIYSADEKRHIGYCNTSDEDYYCKLLERFMEYDKIDGGLDILGKPSDCPLEEISDNSVLENIKAIIREEKDYAFADFERYKVEYLGQDWEDIYDSLPQDDFRYGMERAIEIIDKYKGESEDKE